MAGEESTRARTRRIPLADPATEALARLRLCTDLESVERLGTPQELTLRLFGANANKTLYAPLADALLRGLTHPTPTFSSIALASAASNVLDPTRLAKVLSWTDDGFPVVGQSDPSDLRHDIDAVLGAYVDRNRRLRLLESMWNEVVARNLRIAAVESMVVAVVKSAAKRNTRAASDIAGTFHNARRNMASHEAAAMVLEWHIQNFFAAHAGFVRFASRGRHATYELHLDLTVPATSVTKLEKRIGVAADYLHAAECAALALEQLLPFLPGKRKRGAYTRKLSFTEADADRIRTGALELIRFAAETPDDDAEFLLWNDQLRVYIGYFASIERVPNEVGVPACPKPATTINESAAQVAQLIRLGAVVPPKASEWRTLVLDVCRPYYVLPAIAINAPSWSAEIDRKPVPGTNLTVRVPSDMTELSKWANFMGNCIVSVYGDQVSDGRSVILGIFDGDTLMYNAGIRAKTLNVWEVNSRFNYGDVPPEVTAGLAKLVGSLKNRPSETTAKRSPRRGLPDIAEIGPSGKKRSKTIPPAIWRDLELVANDMRAYDASGGMALADLEQVATGYTRDPADWVSSTVSLARLSPEAVAAALLSRIEKAEISATWTLLTEHPLGPIQGELEPGRFPPAILRALTDISEGSDRAQLSRLLTNPVFEAAWNLARMQAGWRSDVVTLVKTDPAKLRRLVQSDASGSARRALGLVHVAVHDQTEGSAKATGPHEWLDLGSGPAVVAAWRTARLFAPAEVESMITATDHDVSETSNISMDTDELAMFRIQRNLPPARIPRAWFPRRR